MESSMTVDLGMPATPAAPLAERRKSRQLMVGSVPVGGGAPVSVQSMCTTLTADVNATLQQIAELTASGCQIVRVAVPSQDDAEALRPGTEKRPRPRVLPQFPSQRKKFSGPTAAVGAGSGFTRDKIRDFDD